MNQPVQILTKRGGGRLGCSWSVIKSVTKHKALKSLCNLFAKMLSYVGHKKLQSTFLLVQMRRFPLKWLILRQNETQRTTLGLSSLPYWIFLPLFPESVRTVVRAYAEAITKFSGIDRFPFSITYHDSYGAPLRARTLRYQDLNDEQEKIVHEILTRRIPMYTKYHKVFLFFFWMKNS